MRIWLIGLCLFLQVAGPSKSVSAQDDLVLPPLARSIWIHQNLILYRDAHPPLYRTFSDQLRGLGQKAYEDLYVNSKKPSVLKSISSPMVALSIGGISLLTSIVDERFLLPGIGLIGIALFHGFEVDPEMVKTRVIKSVFRELIKDKKIRSELYRKFKANTLSRDEFILSAFPSAQRLLIQNLYELAMSLEEPPQIPFEVRANIQNQYRVLSEQYRSAIPKLKWISTLLDAQRSIKRLLQMTSLSPDSVEELSRKYLSIDSQTGAITQFLYARLKGRESDSASGRPQFLEMSKEAWRGAESTQVLTLVTLMNEVLDPLSGIDSDIYPSFKVLEVSEHFDSTTGMSRIELLLAETATERYLVTPPLYVSASSLSDSVDFAIASILDEWQRESPARIQIRPFQTCNTEFTPIDVNL